MKYSAKYHVFPAIFLVISRKVGFLWDSVVATLLEKCWQISLYVTEVAIAKLYVT